MAKRERKSVHHVEMTDGKRAIILLSGKLNACG